LAISKCDGSGDFARAAWQAATALVICDFHQHDGKKVAESPRSGIATAVGVAWQKKFLCNIASELEFFLFNTSYHDAFVANYRNSRRIERLPGDYQIMQPTRDEPLFRSIRI